MLIEYKIKLENDCVTITQFVDGDSGGGPVDTLDDGGGPVDTLDDGGGPVDTLDDGGGPVDTLDDGGSSGLASRPVIVFGPVIFGGSFEANGQKKSTSVTSLAPAIGLSNLRGLVLPPRTPFVMETQQQALWCWAAVARSVDHYYAPKSNSEQCGIARRVLRIRNCCASPSPGVCNRVARLEEALRVVGRFRAKIRRHLDFDVVKAEIEEYGVVCVRIGWFGGGGHFVAIHGCRLSTSGVRMVDVADPLFPECTMPFDEFVSAYKSAVGGGRWTTTYLCGSGEEDGNVFN